MRLREVKLPTWPKAPKQEEDKQETQPAASNWTGDCTLKLIKVSVSSSLLDDDDKLERRRRGTAVRRDQEMKVDPPPPSLTHSSSEMRQAGVMYVTSREMDDWHWGERGQRRKRGNKSTLQPQS